MEGFWGGGAKMAGMSVGGRKRKRYMLTEEFQDSKFARAALQDKGLGYQEQYPYGRLLSGVVCSIFGEVGNEGPWNTPCHLAWHRGTAHLLM